MGCCDKAKNVDQIYIPMNRRLLEFAKQTTDEELLKRFPTTKLYIFSFTDKTKMCAECAEKFGDMISWFQKYSLLDDPVRNVKWIFEDEMDKNLIVDDMGITKSPTHLLCNDSGYILDIVTGFPSPDWLEQHLLPLVKA